VAGQPKEEATLWALKDVLNLLEGLSVEDQERIIRTVAAFYGIALTE